MSNEKKGDDDFNFGITDKNVAGTAVAETPKTEATPAAAVAPAAPATTTAAVAETEPAKKRGRPKKDAGKTSARISNVNNKAITNVKEPKAEKKALTPREEFLARIEKKSGVSTVTEASKLLAESVIINVRIRDIAVFIEEESSDPLLKVLQEKWTALNIVNLNAQVTRKNVDSVGIEITKDGHLFTPIHCAQLTDSPKSPLQAISGRHRLVFLAIMYGLDIEVPVIVSKYSLNAARCAVIQANRNRRSGVLEEDGFHVLHANNGNIEVEREELYRQSVKRKSDVPAFAVVTVFNKMADRAPYGMKLHFKVQEDGVRSSGLTTKRTLRCFWKKALAWDSPMTRKEYDEQLKSSVAFLNTFVESIEGMTGFDASVHLSTRAMVAVAGMFRLAKDAQKEPSDYAKKIAKALVDQGDTTGSNKSETIYRKLASEVKIG